MRTRGTPQVFDLTTKEREEEMLEAIRELTESHNNLCALYMGWDYRRQHDDRK